MKSSSLYLENEYNLLKDNKSIETEINANNFIDDISQLDKEFITLELQKLEEEIANLQQIITAKIKFAQALRSHLKLSVLNEINKDSSENENLIKEITKFKTTTDTLSRKSFEKLKITANTMKSLEDEMEDIDSDLKKIPCKYNPGDKIFAKVKGFVYWPARVNPLPPDIIIPANKIPIFFYGTHEVYFISPTSCWPYDEKTKIKWGKPKPRAHFNQGMTEIEKYPTIYQYGIDPTAEDFLAQFYQFKKSNGQNAILESSNKVQNINNSVSDNLSDKEKEEKKQNANKKRNKSESSVNMKEKKVLHTEDKKSEKSSTRKRHLSDSDLSSNYSYNHESITENNDGQVGASIRKRQRSGTNSFECEKKLISLDKAESAVILENNLESVEVDESLMFTLSKSNDKVEKNDFNLECISDSVVKLEDNISDLVLITDSLKDVPIGNFCEYESKPKTRCRMKSNNSLNNNKSSIGYSKSTNESDSPSVDSDNPADEDFRPVIKPKRIQKNVKSQKVIKVSSKRPTKQTSKKTIRKSKSSAKSRIKVEDDLVDSLSSISSDEDYKNFNTKNIKDLQEQSNFCKSKEDEVEKKISKELNNSKTTAIELSEPLIIMKAEIFTTAETTVSKDINSADNQYDEIDKINGQTKSEDEILPKCETYIVDQVSPKIEMDVISTAFEKEDCGDLQKSDNCFEQDDNVKLEELNEFNVEEQPEAECKSPKRNQNKKLASLSISDVDDEDLIILDAPAEQTVDKIKEEQITKLKINLKEGKTSNITTKINKKSSKHNNRKRNRKLSSSASSSDSETSKSEKPKSKYKRNKLTERNSESENKTELDLNEKPSLSKIQILQNYNADIRSSLILGREDYKTCLERFKSLCEMQINLVSLVKVWQLMDTVKKCRRYKRNEEVKQEAQSVYKRFMEIYSQASKEEVNTAQSLLMQYRHQNNIQNQNVGAESNKVNGGLVHGSNVPISVADMFQNKLLTDTKSSKTTGDSNNQKMSSTKKISIGSNQSQPTEDEINEEKMRLLSMDLEAKVSDILNKIEKNADVNPINQRSLSHLLPTTDENSLINLPVHWKTVNDKNSVDKDKIEEGEITDDDEEDVDAIVRRIEEVDIKFSESEPISMNIMSSNNNSSSNPSALDARIESLINNSFISNKEPSRMKKSRTSSSKHHKNSGKISSPLVTPNSKSDQLKAVVISSEIPASAIKSAPLISALERERREMHFVSELEEQKDDIEIYDLLGV